MIKKIVLAVLALIGIYISASGYHTFREQKRLTRKNKALSEAKSLAYWYDTSLSD